MTSGQLKRVVITGMGAVTPLGLSVQETWRNAVEGRSGIALITQADMTGSPVTFAGEVKGFEPTRAVGPFRPTPDCQITQILNPKEARKFGRFVHLAMAAGY